MHGYAGAIPRKPFRHTVPHKVLTDHEVAYRELVTAQRLADEAAAACDLHPRSPILREAKAAADHALTAAATAEAAAAAAKAAHEEAGLPMTDTSEWFVVLHALFGDSPFAAKLRKTTAPTSFTACPGCLLLGTKKAPAEDGTPSDTKLQRVAFGGAVCNSLCQYPLWHYTVDGNGVATGDKELIDLGAASDFTYFAQGEGVEGAFSEEAAAEIRVSSDLDKRLAALAACITAEEAQRMDNELLQKFPDLALLGDGGKARHRQEVPEGKDFLRTFAWMSGFTGYHALVKCWSVVPSPCRCHRSTQARMHAVYQELHRQFVNRANKRHLGIGRNGECEFARLPYYECVIIPSLRLVDGCL